jgi:hypothetical protein
MFSRAGRRMGRFRPFISRRILRELALAPVFPNRRNAMTDPNRSATFGPVPFERQALSRSSDGREAVQDRNATVMRLRARAARCADLAAQATSLGLANEFELLAREYEADAASLESASFRR